MAWSISNAMMRNFESLHYSRAQGGGILGGHLLGWRTICAVEYNAYARSVLLARQNDGTLPPFPVWDDVRTFDGKPWRGIVDVVSGGFPCQDISIAGPGTGLDGERSGLWADQRRIIGEVEPSFAYVENSTELTVRGLGTVLSDLAEMGFDAEWGVLSAADAGAPHLRERIWVLGENVANSMRQREQGIIARRANAKNRPQSRQRPDRPRGYGFGRWPVESGMGRTSDGLAYRMDRIKALGNGQVPRVAKAAWEILTNA